ncbi:hypothetical protein NQZ79_g2608 [Umbelopsis isabellina]|nr:hypothetical protein NQZ79_g2608 [Umbelopsis isabellina]
MSKVARIALHLLGCASNLWGLSKVEAVPNPYADGFGGHYQYLTILGLTVATVSFSLCLIRDFVPGFLNRTHTVVGSIAVPVSGKVPNRDRSENPLYTNLPCSIQLEGLISVLYWGMTLVDPHLLVPKDVPPIPMLIDFSLHLFPAIFLWIDFLLFNVEFERSKSHVVNIYLFAIAYYVWTWYCFSKNQYYAYPFLAELSDTGRALFYAGCGTMCWIMYEAGRSTFEGETVSRLGRFLFTTDKERVFEKTGRARTPLTSFATPSPHSEFISMFSVRAVVRQAATVSTVARNVAAKRSIHSSPAALSDHLFVHRNTAENNPSIPFAFNDANKKRIEEIMKRYPPQYKKAAIMPLLDLGQRQNGFTSISVMNEVARLVDVPPMRVEPVGKYFLQLCTTTPCQLGGCGSTKILETIKDHLKLEVGETSKDGKFTLVEVECAGACVNAPVLAINDDYYEDLTPETTKKLLDNLQNDKPITPGPQGGRHTCEYAPGKYTTLNSEPYGPGFRMRDDL